MIDFADARRNMVDCQIRPSDVTLYPVIEAMLSVPKQEFVPRDLRPVAYAADTLDLGEGRFVLDNRVLAKMLDALNVQPDELVLDIGCGLGYSTALLAHLAEMVVGVEEDSDLATEATRILVDQHVDNALVINADLVEGAAKHGPYDVIVIQGGVEDLPDSIADQLKLGGRIGMIRMQGALGKCVVGLKRKSGIQWHPAFDATTPVLPGFARAPEFTFA